MIKVLCDVMQHIFQLFTHVMQCLSQGWRTCGLGEHFMWPGWTFHVAWVNISCGLGEHFMWPASNCATYDRVQHRVW